MNIHTAWKMVRDRLAGSQQEIPKKRIQPRQPKMEQRRQLTIDDADIDAHIKACVEEHFKGVNLTLSNHHARIHELEQIEHRHTFGLNQGG